MARYQPCKVVRSANDRNEKSAEVLVRPTARPTVRYHPQFERQRETERFNNGVGLPKPCRYREAEASLRCRSSSEQAARSKSLGARERTFFRNLEREEDMWTA